MTSRRDFAKTLALGITTSIIAPSCSFSPKAKKLTILHTNDVHSHIDPFPANDSKFANMGGYARRAALVNKIREEEDNILLLDCGDIFQGTPYFNFYKGELDISLMGKMGYDAATLGNHEFDNGAQELAKQVSKATFPFICSNYDLSDSPLNNLTKPYKIFNKGGIKVGVIGVGIELDGLVSPKMYGNIKYNDPINAANTIAKELKQDHKCDVIICLSHLGYSYKEDKVSDITLAQNTQYIDVILGGHTHTFLDKPDVVNNIEKMPVIINQAGWGGIKLGRIDLLFNKEDESKTLAYHKMV